MQLERGYIEAFQGDRRQKLQLCFENLDKVDLYPPDPMHDARHQAQVERTGIWLAEAAGLGEDQKDYIRRAVPFHDSGYAFVQMGILKPEEHNIGSGLITLRKTGDVQLARGIVQHSCDVLPVHITPWVLLLREADRADRWGWQGVISAAYYLGFRHELISGPISYQKNLKGEVEVYDQLRDARHPDTVDYRCRIKAFGHFPVEYKWTWTDYEENAANFARAKIFPYLYKRGLLDKLTQELMHVQDWIEGVESDDSTWDNPKWKIDSVINEGSYGFFSAKRFNTEQALCEIRGYELQIKGDNAKFCAWGQPLEKSGEDNKGEELKLIFRRVMPIDRRGAKTTPRSRRKNIINQDIIYFGDEYKEHELI